MKRINITVLVVWLLCLSSAQAASLPKAAKLVSPETVLLIEVENFAQVQAQFKSTSIYKFYKDPLMAAFFENARTKLRERIQKRDDNDIIKTFYNTGLHPDGRAALAVVINEQTKDANEPPIIVITQWADKIDKIKEAVKQLVQKNLDKGGRQKETEDYKGVTIETMLDENSSPFVYCFVDDCLIASTTADILKFTVAQIKGASSPTLADEQDYASSVAATGPYHDIDIFVNFKQLLKLSTSAGPQGSQEELSALGLDNVKSLGCSVGLARLDSGMSICKAFLKIDGDKKGIIKMLEFQPASLAVPAFVPSSAYTATIVNLNVKNSFIELTKVLGSIAPPLASVLYTPLLPESPDGQQAIELKKDIIDHLGSQLVITQSRDTSVKDMPIEPRTMVAIAVANPSALEKSLSTLHSKKLAPDKPDAKRDFLGHTIYIVDASLFLPSFQGSSERSPLDESEDAMSEQAPKLAFTITDTFLILGSEKTVEQALRTLNDKSSSLGSAKWFNSARSAIQSAVGFAVLEDIAPSIESFWQMTKKATQDSGTSEGQQQVTIGLSAGASGTVSPFLMFPEGDLINPKLLPDFDAVRKYFGLMVFYGISRPDGFFFEFKDLPPVSKE